MVQDKHLNYGSQDSHLGHEASCFHWWDIFAINNHIVTKNIIDRYIFDTVAHIFPRKTSLKGSWCFSTDFTSVVTLTGAKVTTIPSLRTSLHLAHWHNTNTPNFVDILEGQTPVSWMSWWQNATRASRSLVALALPSL